MKQHRFYRILLLALIACVFALALIACDNKDPDSKPGPSLPQEPDPVTISISNPVGNNILQKNETVTLTVTVENADDKTYAWSVDREDLLTHNGDTWSVKSDAEIPVMGVSVTVTATAHADPQKAADYIFLVKPTVSGELGELTAALIKEISDPSITVTGTVTDVVRNDLNPSENSRDSYDMKVMMEDGGWYGEWNVSYANPADPYEYHPVITDQYARGEAGPNGLHEHLRVYIDRHNAVTRTPVTDGMGRTIAWEGQYLWNHLDLLGADIGNKFAYDKTNDVYAYQIDWEPKGGAEYSDDAWLMTYLAVSLTPMLTENFESLWLQIEDGHITKIYAQSAITTYTADDGTTVTGQTYTEVELELSDIGTTKIPDPTPYSAPYQADKLENAITHMKAANNYTFQSVETMISAPTGDEGDFLDGADGSFGGSASTLAMYHGHNANHTGLSGDKEGVIGYVTPDTILFEDWKAYTAYMDELPYYVTYSGYHQYEDYYTEFEDNDPARHITVTGLIETQRFSGSMWDSIVPQWDFSSAIFSYVNETDILLGGDPNKPENHKKGYKFRLHDSSLVGEIVPQLVMSSYSEYASAASYAELTITVDEDGMLREVVYPFSSNDVYIGYATVTFSKVGTTKLDESAFTPGPDYIQREYMDTWSKYGVMYYRDRDQTITADQVFNELWGTNAVNKIPAPKVFIDLLGDTGTNLFYEETDDIKTDYAKWTLEIADPTLLASKNRPKNIAEILGPDGLLTQAILKTPGWTYSLANSGAPSATSDYYFATFINTELPMMLKIENNGTQNLFVTFYRSVDAWSLSSWN